MDYRELSLKMICVSIEFIEIYPTMLAVGEDESNVICSSMHQRSSGAVHKLSFTSSQTRVDRQVSPEAGITCTSLPGVRDSVYSTNEAAHEILESLIQP